jgi:hypothetical protein
VLRVDETTAHNARARGEVVTAGALTAASPCTRSRHRARPRLCESDEGQASRRPPGSAASAGRPALRGRSPRGWWRSGSEPGRRRRRRAVARTRPISVSDRCTEPTAPPERVTPRRRRRNARRGRNPKGTCSAPPCRPPRAVRPLATRPAGATDSRVDQQGNGDRGRSLMSNAGCLTGFDRLPMPCGLGFAHLRFTAHDAFRVSPVRLIPRQTSLLLATESLLNLRGLEGGPSEVRSAK